MVVISIKPLVMHSDIFDHMIALSQWRKLVGYRLNCNRTNTNKKNIVRTMRIINGVNCITNWMMNLFLIPALSPLYYLTCQLVGSIHMYFRIMYYVLRQHSSPSSEVWCVSNRSCLIQLVKSIFYLKVLRTYLSKELRFLKSAPYLTWDCFRRL